MILDEAPRVSIPIGTLTSRQWSGLMKGRNPRIVIAHRLRQCRTLDRILVFDRGEIVEQGTHASLANRPGESIAGCSSARPPSSIAFRRRSEGVASFGFAGSCEPGMAGSRSAA